MTLGKNSGFANKSLWISSACFLGSRLPLLSRKKQGLDEKVAEANMQLKDLDDLREERRGAFYPSL